MLNLIFYSYFFLLDIVVYCRLRIQVEDEDFYDGPDDSDYDTDDSNGISLFHLSSLPFLM
jgi:hypothetical protein